MTIINPLDLDNLHLARGCHKPGDDKMCTMEAVAYIAGEPWSAHPECASRVIAAFVRTWNDDLNDYDRQQLGQYIFRLVGSAGTPGQEDARAWMAIDWLVRDYTPTWLRLAGLTDQADQVASLPELTAGTDITSTRHTIDAARKDVNVAGAAAWSIAGIAIEATAGTAAAAAAAVAMPAAGDHAGFVAWVAAKKAVGAAADAAAKDVVRAVAGSAAWAALAPAVTQCQQSAHRLIDRMLQVTGR